MKCPICHIESLSEVNLDTGLLAYQCTNCLGHWIPSERYWEWLDYREQVQATKELQPSNLISHQSPRPVINLSTGGLLPVIDNTTANFCADCSRLMTKTRVGRGLNFYVDRCSHCHGVWLDQNEWENLVQMDLHHKIHYMFSSAWQFSVRQERNTSQKTPA
ncbi:MAG: zf-TFIIB domain-containing protein [Cyanobacteria bacterium J06621_11]